MDRIKKLLEYSPLLIPIIAILVILWTLFGRIPKIYPATISYICDYMGTISQVDIPDKDLKIIILDTRQLIVEPFGEFIKKFNPAVKAYAVAEVRMSTKEVLKMYFYEDLGKAKERAVKSAQENQKTLKFKEHEAGKKFSEWFGKTEIQ